MNISILIANILILLAFFIHTFMGDRELKTIEPASNTENLKIKQEKWTMARCGWHWISFDLLFASILLTIINFTNFFENEKTLLQLFTIYFLGYSFVWIITIVFSKQFNKNFFKLGQWILLLVISGLIYYGIN
jgi:hypothetical protein